MNRQMRLLCAAGALLCGTVAFQSAASAATILLIGTTSDVNNTGMQSYLQGLGYTVTLSADTNYVSQPAKVAAIYGTYDLVLISRFSTSANFNNSGDSAAWNALRTPVIMENAKAVIPVPAGNPGWGWFGPTATTSNMNTLNGITGFSSLQNTSSPVYSSLFSKVTDATKLFATATTVDNLVNTGTGGTGTGTVFASYTSGATSAVGLEYFAGGVATNSVTPAGNRLYAPMFSSNTFANLTADGKQLLANEVATMVPEPVSLGFACVSSLFLLRRRPRHTA